MPRIPGHIEVAKLADGSGCHITVDGETFPYICADSGISTTVERDGIPAITLTLIADRVTVDQALA